MSQPAASSASSAASPPREKSATARPSRPPICSRSTSPAAEQLRGSLRLEPEQRAQLLGRPVERRVAERAPVVRRQVDASQLEVARHVLQEVHELEAGADRVARLDELRVVEPPQDAEHEPAARVGRVDAVVLQVVPRLVLGHPLIHAVRLDQPQERLARQVELPDRRLHVPQDGPGRLPGEGRVHLPLELVERLEPVALVRVAELVDEPRVAVQRADVRPQRAGEEHRADGEVLAGGAGCDLGELHATILA